MRSLDSVEGSECAGAMTNVGADQQDTQEYEFGEKFVTAPSSASWYHSARIERMMEKSGEWSSEVESEIEASRAHWSVVNPAVSESEHSAKANGEYFEALRHRRYVREGDQLVAKQLKRRVGFFGMMWDVMVVGEKLAERGQGEIYAARFKGEDDYKYALKVFKAGSVLDQLEKQFPPAFLKLCQFDEGEPLPPDHVWGCVGYC